MKTLIIVRHGNTFLPNETPTRVGRGTDLPLVEEKRGRAVGKYLLSENYVLNKVFSAPLKRTMQTTQLILEEMKSSLDIISESNFLEIDYGPDENKTEEQVIARIGKSAIDEWDAKATVPDGWSVDVPAIIESWDSFSDAIEEGQTVLLCSSNGIIRFAPHILDVFYQRFCELHTIKVTTGSVSIFTNEDGKWMCKEWNTKAYNLF